MEYAREQHNTDVAMSGHEATPRARAADCVMMFGQCTRYAAELGRQSYNAARQVWRGCVCEARKGCCRSASSAATSLWAGALGYHSL